MRTFFFNLLVLPTAFLLSQSDQRATRWEEMLRSTPKAENLRSWMERLSARPHHVGSPYDKENAEWILSKFREFGFSARIESFDVLFPTPKERAVELLEPIKFSAALLEPVEKADPTSNQSREQLPTYNAYSVDGDVTAPLVYVNYGIQQDYVELERLGVSVRGAIVIARYGASWRGIKPKLAAEKGAIGCIIYSDPHEDGYFQGDVFPEGPYRNKDGVQRGSVMDMPLYPGDPLTPGVGATEKARRLDLKDAKTITHIPVLPISFSDARPLLESLKGPVAPASWRGSLPLTYHIGPGPAKVHLQVQSNWDIKRLYNVIATIPGTAFPDEWIIRGNHHDAWVNGSEDPVSGQVAMLEEARALGELLKQGWKPKRTILYCAWDGEEEGLLGSTEWAEAHADELEQKAAVYINSDSNGRGYLGVEGSHTLEQFINGVAKSIQDPEKNISVWKRSQLGRIANARSPEDKSDVRQRTDLRISALGSGSDYTVFLDHLGVASLDIGFGGEDGGGIYHSIYDDFYWYTHFSDKDFLYGIALAQTGGTAVLRLADADILPFDFSNFAETVKKYLDELKLLLNSKQEEIQEQNKELDEGVFSATADPRETHIAPPYKEIPPHLNFAPLENASDSLTRAAGRFKTAAATKNPSTKDRVKSLNRKLMQSERFMTSKEGLPGRPWFRHMIYAPGFYTGYGVKTLPGVREAIEQGDWKLAESEIIRAAAILEQEAALIDSAAEELQGR